MLKRNGIKAFNTVLFDIDQNNISVFIDEINVWHRIRLREDPRINFVMFFEEQHALIALLKEQKEEEEESKDENKENGNKDNNKKASKADKKLANKEMEEKKKKLKDIGSIEEMEKQFNSNEYRVFKIYDRVKIFVDTTTEFPLDITCKLVLTPEDEEKYLLLEDAQIKLAAEKESAKQRALENGIEVETLEQFNEDI